MFTITVLETDRKIYNVESVSRDSEGKWKIRLMFSDDTIHLDFNLRLEIEAEEFEPEE